MNNLPTVLITAPFDPKVAHELQGICNVILANPLETSMSLADTSHRQYLANADVIVAELDVIDDAVLSLATRLSVVIACRSMPVNVDLAACKVRGVEVKTTPARNADVTADGAFGLLLNALRQIGRSETWMRNHKWSSEDVYYPYREFRGPVLNRKTMGIVGGGAVGRRMASRARGFGMEVFIYDPFVSQEELGDLGRIVDLSELMSSSDVISIHAPLIDATRNLIGARELALMKPTAFLINAGRAHVVNEEALREVLESERIAGAGLDVFWEEPLPNDHWLLRLESVTVTPHIAGASDDVVSEHSRMALEHILDWIASKS
jgi:phosphoglycerate dehydrogenase-like enzyme